MTDYEKLMADKKFLIKLLTMEGPTFSDMLNLDYWCRNDANGWKCPHYPKCNEGEGECLDNHTDKEVAEMWLNEEYKEEENDNRTN